MTLSSINNGITCRTRTIRRTGDDAHFLADFNQYYKSLEESEQLWAIDQIPLSGINGGPLAVAQCFQYFCESLNLEETEMTDALHAAISRELINPVLKPDERYSYVLPIVIKCINSNINGKWVHLLHRICKMIKNTLQQSVAFDYANEMIKESSYFSGICASHMIAGLCEAGATMPNSLVTSLLDHLHIFELCYQPVFSSLMMTQSTNYVNNVADQLLTNNPAEGPLISTCLMMHSLPEKLSNWMKMILNSPNMSSDLVCSIAKNRTRLIQLGFFTEQKIMQIVWSSSLFTPPFFENISDYFQRAISYMKENDALSFLKRICQSESPYSVKLTALFIKLAKSKPSINFAVSFLCMPKAFMYFQEWIKSFDIVVNTVTSEHANNLTQALINNLMNEVEIGHMVTKDGAKIIGEIEPKRSRKNMSVFVKGWREMSQMIEALSHSPSKFLLRGAGMKVVRKALDVHLNPLASSVIAYLHAITANPEVIYEFFSNLFQGNSTKQIFLIKILPPFLKTLDKSEMIEKVGIPLVSLVKKEAPLNIKCAVLKFLPEFMIFGQVFTSSTLCKMALNAFRKAEYEQNNYLGEVINSLAAEYSKMERCQTMAGNENIDTTNIVNNNDAVKPVSRASRMNKRHTSIGIKGKNSTILKPVTLPKVLPPI